MKAALIGFLVVGVIGASLLWGAALGYTAAVPGDPTRFDPVASLQDVRRFACPGCALVELEGWGVRADGTLDLTADYGPSARYAFEERSPRGPSGPPGAGRRARLRVEVDVRAPGMSGSVNSLAGASNFYSFGMVRAESLVHGETREGLAPPCSWRQLWTRALERGAPPDGVAWIRYDHSGVQFSIQDTPHTYRFTHDCTPTAQDAARSSGSR